jgi:hypothetical protein
MVRNGRIVNENLRPTGANARAENRAGHPVLHLCYACDEDFGGRALQRRHRVGGKLRKRCLSSFEMAKKGWRLDPRGRWRGPRPEIHI